MADIPHNIRRMRRVLGWSQEKLAEYLGTSRQTIANWETKKHAPPANKYCKLVERYEKELKTGVLK